LCIDKGKYINCLGRSRMSLTDFIFTDHHIAAFFNLYAFDNMLGFYLFSRRFVDTLVTHAIHGALVQPIEVYALGGGCRNESYRNMYQSETDRALPNCPCHISLLEGDAIAVNYSTVCTNVADCLPHVVGHNSGFGCANAIRANYPEHIDVGAATFGLIFDQTDKSPL